MPSSIDPDEGEQVQKWKALLQAAKQKKGFSSLFLCWMPAVAWSLMIDALRKPERIQASKNPNRPGFKHVQK